MVSFRAFRTTGFLNNSQYKAHNSVNTKLFSYKAQIIEEVVDRGMSMAVGSGHSKPPCCFSYAFELKLKFECQDETGGFGQDDGPPTTVPPFSGRYKGKCESRKTRRENYDSADIFSADSTDPYRLLLPFL
jgi:hypothetical protein